MSTKSILIIDDEIIIRKGLSAFLETYGYEISEAESAEDAENILMKNQFDLAVVDMRLPGITGEEFILKVYNDYPNMKFIIYTGSREYLTPEPLKNTGITQEDIFTKPVSDISLLVNRINTLLT